MEHGRISGGQMVMIMFWGIMGTAVITLPILIALHAPRAAWIAGVFFIVGGICLAVIIGWITPMAGEQGFVQYVQQVFGKWIGKMLLFIFLAWMFHTTSLIVWEITGFTQVSLLPNTPLLVIKLIITLPAVYAVYLGLESVARCAQVLFILTIGAFFALFFLHVPDYNVQNLLPVLDDGVVNILRSTLAPLAWAGEIMLVLFLAPYIKSPKRITFLSTLTIILIGVGGIINEITYTAVFGPLRQHLISPFYSLIRYIRPTAFAQRFDVIFVAINLVGNFIKLAIFFYIFVLAFAQTIGLKSYRPVIIPFFISLLILSTYFVNSMPGLIHFLDSVYPFYAIPVLYGLPCLVLIVGILRKYLLN